MKIDNTTIITKSQRLADELKSLAFEKESHSDEVFQFVSENERVTEFIERLTDIERVEQMIGMLKESECASGRARLINDLDRLRRRNDGVKVMKILSGVAAVLCSVSILLWYIDDLEQSKIAIKNKTYLESITVPTLLTHNERMYLSKKKGGVVDDPFYSVNSDESGHLVYSSKSVDSSLIKKNVHDELVVPSNYISKITLSDGSVVTMNACSKMRYPVLFVGESREVELEGEAYFKVTKSDKPFIVKSGEMRIKVYGTEFNVKAYKSGIREAVLVSGKVGVSTVGKDEIVLLPNQLAVCGKNNVITISSVDATEYLYWMDHKFKFKSTPLPDVLEELSRWYGVKFIKVSNYSELRISIFSDRDNSLDDLLSLIESVSDVKFVKEGGKVYSINE